MKCTLIIGPQCSGKSTAAKKLAEQFLRDEVCFTDEVLGTRYQIDFAHSLQFHLPSNCKMIVVEAIKNIETLSQWLLLARNAEMISNLKYKAAKRIVPEFVLIFQSDIPYDKVLTESQLRRVTVIQTACPLPEPEDGAFCD